MKGWNWKFKCLKSKDMEASFNTVKIRKWYEEEKVCEPYIIILIKDGVGISILY